MTEEQRNERAERLCLKLCRELKRRNVRYIRHCEEVEESADYLGGVYWEVCAAGWHFSIYPERGSIHYQAWKWTGQYERNFAATAHETRVKALLDDILNRKENDLNLKNHNRKGA